MLNSFPVAVLAGALLGFLAGLGVGGGSLLILWLTLVLDYPQEAARAINLLFFLPAAGISSLIRLRRGSLPVRKALPAIVTGCIFAAAATWISGTLELGLVKKLFGGLLLFTGIRELIYKPQKPKEGPD